MSILSLDILSVSPHTHTDHTLCRILYLRKYVFCRPCFMGIRLFFSSNLKSVCSFCTIPLPSEQLYISNIPITHTVPRTLLITLSRDARVPLITSRTSLADRSMSASRMSSSRVFTIMDCSSCDRCSHSTLPFAMSSPLIMGTIVPNFKSFLKVLIKYFVFFLDERKLFRTFVSKLDGLQASSVATLGAVMGQLFSIKLYILNILLYYNKNQNTYVFLIFCQ